MLSLVLSERSGRVKEDEWNEDDEHVPQMPPLRGHLAGRGRLAGRRAAPERQLLAAILLRALADALRGDEAAADWMDRYAPGIAGLWLDIDPEAVRGWRGLVGVRPTHFWDGGPGRIRNTARTSAGRRATKTRRRRRARSRKQRAG